MKKIPWFLVALFIFPLLAIAVFAAGFSNPERQEFGVVFSQKHAKDLGLDWKAAYLALLDDLGARDIKIAAHWDLIEREKGQYDFSDIDWQLNEAGKRGARVMLVIGMKTPRWPECHIPGYAKGLNKEGQQAEILNLVEACVKRYAQRPEITVWQVENEPLFHFGDCPWTDPEFLKKEISLVKSLDEQKRPVLISDSGEGSLWFRAASLGDVVGVTMYRRVWFKEIKSYISYPIPALWYRSRAMLVEAFFNKQVLCVELQAEPWCPSLLYNCSIEEQKKTMDLEQFNKNLAYARKTGMEKYYLWGGEWWYWMKEKQNDPAFWNEAKSLFQQ